MTVTSSVTRMENPFLITPEFPWEPHEDWIQGTHLVSEDLFGFPLREWRVEFNCACLEDANAERNQCVVTGVSGAILCLDSHSSVTTRLVNGSYNLERYKMDMTSQ